ncbi:MAG: ABC transporter ATP-binding protein [Terriglobales bacterium]
MTSSATKLASAEARLQPAQAGALLSVRNVVKRFGAREVLRGISLDVAEGEFLTILGESGSGKTTLLRLIGGFERADAGEIWMGSERLDPLPPYRRRVNTVFQHYALFPHLSVQENVAYGLRVRGVAKAEIATRVEEALAMVKMSGFAESAPGKISGGQQQRVALARALVNRPGLLLLDEPLSALDANLRSQMRVELKALQREVGISFVFVTHDQEEAMALSDRVALLRAGALEQVASPREIYHRPATAYAAQFIGQTNLLRCRVEGGVARVGGLSWKCDGSDGEAVFSLRPENIRPADERGPSGRVVFQATASNRSFAGATELLELDCAGGLRLLARVSSQPPAEGERSYEFSAGDAVRVRDSGER